MAELSVRMSETWAAKESCAAVSEGRLEASPETEKPAGSEVLWAAAQAPRPVTMTAEVVRMVVLGRVGVRRIGVLIATWELCTLVRAAQST